jgi:hypothetical protein
MNIKKILLVAVVVFAIYYVLHSPQIAGKTLHTAAQNSWHEAKGIAVSLTKFFNTLFS